jgi:two-component system, OmpR family, alkaline phosphatase synthesis response regulator PhoP
MRILYVEDEESIRELTKLNLELDGYEVVSTYNPSKAIVYFNEQHFDLILLDIMLPEMSGIQLCEQFRIHNDQVPIIFLTAKNATEDKILGLKKGADDYITKPYNMEELILRVNKLLKRSQRQAGTMDDEYVFGENKINFATLVAINKEGTFHLTKKEIMLLKLLIERKNEVVSRQQILQTVWGYDVYPSTRTIDNFILNFRKYFEVDPSKPLYFQSIRGIGYRFGI